MLTPGDRIDRYEIEALLGRGGMGEVYAARDPKLERRVALKMLHGSTDARARARLLREARTVAAFEHPNAVIIYDVGEHDGAPFLAMEFVRGRPLRSYVGDASIPIARRLRWLVDVARALAAAHRAGIVHRDVKPDNIMVCGNSTVKVLDFGIAQRLPDASMPTEFADRARLTGEGEVIGTPLYLSPEQIRGEDIKPSTDQFAWGVMAYELLSGALPWSVESAAILTAQILERTPTRLRERAADVPEAIERAVMRALEKRAASRFASLDDAADALAPFAEVGDPRSLRASSGEGALSVAPESGDAFARTERASGSAEIDTPERSRDALKPLAEPTSTLPLALVARPAENTEARSATSAASIQAALPAKSARRKDRLRLVIAASLALATAVAAVYQARRSPPAPMAPPETPPTAQKPIAITDLPPPRSASPQALSAYAAASQSLRDANQGQARASLEEALRFDPSIAMAHLRLAMMVDQRDMLELRSRYALAVRGRTSLDERDQDVLRALEPIYAQDPSDFKACRERVKAATERRPLDAELFVLLASTCSDGTTLEEDVKAASRAAELDPHYAGAWSVMSSRLTDLRRFDESMRATNRCLEISTTSSDCFMQRADIHAWRGECGPMEADLREARATGSTPTVALYDEWVQALYSLDRPSETILQVLQQKWQILPEASRAAAEIFDRADLDAYDGQFTRAQERLLEGMKVIDAEPGEEIHGRFAVTLVNAYSEPGNLEAAARVAADYINRRDAWQGALERERTIWMLGVMARGGLLSRAEFEEKRAAAVEQQKKKRGSGLSAWDEWSLRHHAKGSAEEANAAIAALPKDAGPQPGWLSGKLGFIYERAGMHDLAIPRLRESLVACHMRSPEVYLALGDALKATGDRAEACTMYTKVLNRWGHAKPRSVTAEKARARAPRVCAVSPSLGAKPAP